MPHTPNSQRAKLHPPEFHNSPGPQIRQPTTHKWRYHQNCRLRSR